MRRYARLLTLFGLALILTLAACDGDEESTDETLAATATPGVLPTMSVAAAPTDTLAPPPTSTAAPTLAPEPTATSTSTPTPSADGQTGQGGQTQDPGAAGTAVTAAGQAGGLMAPWADIIGVAVFNQTLCTALQGLAQTGQQGGLASLGVTARVLTALGALQLGQQRLAGLMNLSEYAGLLGTLQADQAALGNVLGQWSGGQIDAAAAGAALQAVCGATNTTLGQAQQGAQDAGVSQPDVDSMLDISKRDAAGSLGGVLP